MNDNKVCGTCQWHIYDRFDECYACKNDNSEYCTDWTEYNDTCDCWEGK